MKFLVIRLSSIGDIVLASPVLRCIKKQVGGAEVHFLTKSSFKKVTEANPYISKFFYYDHNMAELIKCLKKENYDYIIDLHNNIRTFRIKWSLKGKSFTINKLNWQKFLLTTFRINVMPGNHITKRSLDTVKSFGVKDDGFGLDYFIPPEDIVNMVELPASHAGGYVAIAIGASYFTKRLPLHKLKELCSLIDQPVILLGGKEDEDNGAKIAAVDPWKIYNACGKYNINQSADIVKKARLVISNDTGLQYIACAFNKQVLAIWGGTSPKLDVEPVYGDIFLSQQENPPYENIIVPNLWCQPCSKFGKKKCPLRHFKCMELHDIKIIAAKVTKRLKE